jgi:hypothetical protein
MFSTCPQTCVEKSTKRDFWVTRILDLFVGAGEVVGAQIAKVPARIVAESGLKVEVIPVGNLATDICNKLHHAILRDHDRDTMRAIAAKPIGRTMPSSGSLGGFWNPLLSL